MVYDLILGHIEIDGRTDRQTAEHIWPHYNGIRFTLQTKHKNFPLSPVCNLTYKQMLYKYPYEFSSAPKSAFL
jgi:hypothetical protein